MFSATCVHLWVSSVALDMESVHSLHEEAPILFLEQLQEDCCYFSYMLIQAWNWSVAGLKDSDFEIRQGRKAGGSSCL